MKGPTVAAFDVNSVIEMDSADHGDDSFETFILKDLMSRQEEQRRDTEQMLQTMVESCTQAVAKAKAKAKAKNVDIIMLALQVKAQASNASLSLERFELLLHMKFDNEVAAVDKGVVLCHEEHKPEVEGRFAALKKEAEAAKLKLKADKLR